MILQQLEPEDESYIRTEPALYVPKNTRMNIVRHFRSGLAISVECDNDTELNVIAKDTTTHSYTVGNIKHINVHLHNEHFQYDVSTGTITKSGGSDNIMKIDNIIDINLQIGVYHIDLSNPGSVSFSNFSIPYSNLDMNMIH